MYHGRVTIATMRRILEQLRHDPRTIGLIFIVPCVLLGLLYWLYHDQMIVFDRIAPALLGVFPFVIMFIITSITTLRERTGGTMERLMASPIGKLDLILGYMLAFGLLAIVQALLASALLIYGFDLTIAGPTLFLVVMALLDALLGTALGLFVSAFARTEFQAIQFMPAIILPQFLIGGLLLPLDKMPHALDIVAHFMPLTYAIDALNRVTSEATLSFAAWRDLWVVVGCIVVAVLLGALTLRRKTN